MAPGPGFNNNLNTERSIVGTFSQMSFLSESSPGGRLKLSAITDDTRIGSPPVTDGKKQPFSREQWLRRNEIRRAEFLEESRSPAHVPRSAFSVTAHKQKNAFMDSYSSP